MSKKKTGNAASRRDYRARVRSWSQVDVDAYRRRAAHGWQRSSTHGTDVCPHCGLFRRRVWPLPLLRESGRQAAGIMTLYRAAGTRVWSTERPACRSKKAKKRSPR